MAMMRSARAWGLVVAICGTSACKPDTSGLGDETADPSSSGTSTGAVATTSTAGSTDSTTAPVDGTETTAAPDDGTTTTTEGTTTEGTTTSSESTADTSPDMTVQRCAMPGLDIPEAPAEGVTSMIDIPEDGTIVELRVIVQATHSWVGDLVFELRKDGDVVTVIDRPGADMPHCNGDDIDVVLHDDAVDTIDAVCTDDDVGLSPALLGEVRPDELLGPTFGGQSTMGAWQLHVTDNGTEDVGQLDTWCLQIVYE